MAATSAAWTPLHARLLAALDAELLLPRLAEALPAGGRPSARADLALLDALRAAPALSPALGALRDGDPQPLRAALDQGYPDRLPPAVTHHLALRRLRDGTARGRREGLRGLLWLIDAAPDHLHNLARAAAGDDAPVSPILEALPTWLLDPEREALIGLTADPGPAHDRARAAWKTLEQLALRARADDLSPALRGAVDGVARAALRAAVDRVIDDLQRALTRAEQAIAAEVWRGLDALFEPAARLVETIGHDEALSVWIVQESVTLAWDLYRARRFAPLRALLASSRPFSDDLERRLLADEAFGHQSTFADDMVLRAESTTSDDARQALLRRALRLNPRHRNASVCLASSDLRVAERALRELLATWPLSALPTKLSRRRFEHARDLLEEAAELRPEHSRLASTRDLLERVRQRLRLD